MDLHHRIMNILADPNKAGTDDARLAYLNGHRDSRHEAAEIACGVEDELNRLRSALTEIVTGVSLAYEAVGKGFYDEALLHLGRNHAMGVRALGWKNLT